MKREEMAPTLQKSLLSPQFCFEGGIQGLWALKGAVDSPPRSLTIMCRCSGCHFWKTHLQGLRSGEAGDGTMHLSIMGPLPHLLSQHPTS